MKNKKKSIENKIICNLQKINRDAFIFLSINQYTALTLLSAYF